MTIKTTKKRKYESAQVVALIKQKLQNDGLQLLKSSIQPSI